MPASTPRRDTLLLACRMVIYGLLVIFGLALVLVGGLMIFGAFANPELAARMALNTAISFLLVAIAFRFLRLLGWIVDSVGRADPFTLANARRLQQMAWLALAFQLIAVVIHWRGGDFRVIHIDGVALLFSSAGGLSLHGFLLALVLLVLARVFRQGAAMREDLEGTV